MLHFAIIAPPLRGHYTPLSNLAAELIARRYRLTFVHQEEVRSLVQAQGAEFFPIGACEPPVERWTHPMARIRGLTGLGRMMQRMERFTAMFCCEAPAVMRSLGVDAVIADQLEPAGGLVAQYLGIPWISIATTLPMNRESGVPPPFVGWRYDRSPQGIRRNEGGWTVSDFILRSFNRAIATNAAALGLLHRNRIEACFSPLLQLSQLIPSLDFPRSELPASFHYVGQFRGAPEPPFTLPPSDGRQTVYCSLGTLQGSRVPVFRNVAKACNRLGLRLILTQGGHAKRQPVKAIPGDALVYDWLPQQAVLDQADLVACHGGMNTVLDTLWAGLPLVVVPLAFEQPAIAARVAHSRAGLMISRRSSAARIAAALGAIRDKPSFRMRAAELRDELRAAGGAPRAADLIEQALGVFSAPADPTRGRAAANDARDDSRSGNR